MNNFNKNPFEQVKKTIKEELSSTGLESKLQDKFAHKPFNERFGRANVAFVAMSFAAQLASLITAVAMLNILFIGLNPIVKVLLATVLIIGLEVIKRESLNDSLKDAFQYQSFSFFSIFLTALCISTSLYIAVQGAKELPNLLLIDESEPIAAIANTSGLEGVFDSRIKSIEQQRDEYKNSRLYKGRLSKADGVVITDYNKSIQKLQEEKAAESSQLKAKIESQNKELKAAFLSNNNKKEEERHNLASTLVFAAISFEILFLLCLLFSWWYYRECVLEDERILDGKNTEEAVNQAPKTTSIPSESSETPRAAPSNKIGFFPIVKDDKEGPRDLPTCTAKNINHGKETKVSVKTNDNRCESETAKSDITKKADSSLPKCKNCQAHYLPKHHKQKYCEDACRIENWELRNGKKLRKK